MKTFLFAIFAIKMQYSVIFIIKSIYDLNFDEFHFSSQASIDVFESVFFQIGEQKRNRFNDQNKISICFTKS